MKDEIVQVIFRLPESSVRKFDAMTAILNTSSRSATLLMLMDAVKSLEPTRVKTGKITLDPTKLGPRRDKVTA